MVSFLFSNQTLGIYSTCNVTGCMHHLVEQCSGFVPIHREQEQSEEVWHCVCVLHSPRWKCTIQCPLGTSVAIECGAMYSFVQYAQRNKQIEQSLLYCDG